MISRIGWLALALGLSLAPFAYGSTAETKRSSAFAEQPTLKEACLLIVKNPKDCVDLAVALGSFKPKALAHEYGLTLYSRGPSKIKTEFLPGKSPILTKEFVDQAREKESLRGTVLDKLDQRQPGLLKGIVDRYAFFKDPSEEFANGFAFLAFQVRRPRSEFSDFLVEQFAADRKATGTPFDAEFAKSLGYELNKLSYMDLLPLFARSYFETLRKRMAPAIPAKVWLELRQRPEPKRTKTAFVTPSTPPSEGLGRAVGAGIEARIKRPTTEPKPWSPPPPPPPQPKLVFSTAFTESPSLKRACALVMTDPKLCTDIRVFRGSQITDFLDHMEAFTPEPKTAVKIESYSSDLTPETLASAAKEFPEADVRLLRTLADWLRRNTGQTRVFFFRQSRFSPILIAHRYAKTLFENHSSQIRPEFLAHPGKPILTDDFVWNAYDEADEIGTVLSQASYLTPRNGNLESLARWQREFMAKPETEFFHAFAFLAFRIDRPKASLNDFIQLELIMQSDTPERLAQLRRVVPKAKTIDLLTLVERRWYKVLWKRVTPALKRR